MRIDLYNHKKLHITMHFFCCKQKNGLLLYTPQGQENNLLLLNSVRITLIQKYAGCHRPNIFLIHRLKT